MRRARRRCMRRWSSARLRWRGCSWSTGHSFSICPDSL
jgi:hypothetical protein